METNLTIICDNVVLINDTTREIRYDCPYCKTELYEQLSEGWYTFGRGTRVSNICPLQYVGLSSEPFWSPDSMYSSLKF